MYNVNFYNLFKSFNESDKATLIVKSNTNQTTYNDYMANNINSFFDSYINNPLQKEYLKFLINCYNKSLQ